MKARNIILMLALVLIGLNSAVYAQTISQSVIGATGSTHEQLSYTVGEPVVFTGQTADLILTQGFHQSDAKVITSVGDPTNNTQVTFFPNPTSDQVILQMETVDRFSLQIELMSVDGKLLAPIQVWEGFGNEQTSVDLEFLPEGMYLIHLRDLEGNLLKTVRTMKAQ